MEVNRVCVGSQSLWSYENAPFHPSSPVLSISAGVFSEPWNNEVLYNIQPVALAMSILPLRENKELAKGRCTIHAATLSFYYPTTTEQRSLSAWPDCRCMGYHLYEMWPLPIIALEDKYRGCLTPYRNVPAVPAGED